MTSNRRRFDVKLKPTLNQVFVLGVLKHLKRNKHVYKNVIIQVYTTLKDKVSLNNLKRRFVIFFLKSNISFYPKIDRYHF